MQTVKSTSRDSKTETKIRMTLSDLRPVDIAFICASVALLLWLYKSVFIVWYAQWMKTDSEYSHAVLVPFISAFIIWLKRKQLAEVAIRPSMLGYVFIVPSLLVMLVMSWAGATNPQGLMFPVIIWGMVLVLLGKEIAKHLRFPIAYLFFMCTLPGDVLTKVTFRIQIISTMGATMILNLFGLHADRAGNLITLPNIEVMVAAPCSGFRMLISLLAFAVLLAYLKEGPLWGRLMLVAVTLPLSIVLNSLRIMMVALVGEFFGSETMHAFHDYSGYIVLAMAFVVLPLLARLFRCQKFNSTLV